MINPTLYYLDARWAACCKAREADQEHEEYVLEVWRPTSAVAKAKPGTIPDWLLSHALHEEFRLRKAAEHAKSELLAIDCAYAAGMEAST